MHDSQGVEEVPTSDSTARGAWADSVYWSKELESVVKARGSTSRIHRKGYRNRPSHNWEKAGNRSRARVEHVFGSQQNGMGGTLVRSIGLIRVRARLRSQESRLQHASSGSLARSGDAECLLQSDSCRQRLIQFVNDAIHLVAEELVHLSQVALAVECANPSCRCHGLDGRYGSAVLGNCNAVGSKV